MDWKDFLTEWINDWKGSMFSCLDFIIPTVQGNCIKIWRRLRDHDGIIRSAIKTRFYCEQSNNCDAFGVFQAPNSTDRNQSLTSAGTVLMRNSFRLWNPFGSKKIIAFSTETPRRRLQHHRLWWRKAWREPFQKDNNSRNWIQDYIYIDYIATI